MLFIDCHCLKMAPKFEICNSKFTKEQEMLHNGPIDGVQRQFNKNWLDRLNIGLFKNT